MNNIIVIIVCHGTVPLLTFVICCSAFFVFYRSVNNAFLVFLCQSVVCWLTSVG